MKPLLALVTLTLTVLIFEEKARQIAGDDDAQGEILMLRPYTILRVTLYRFP